MDAEDACDAATATTTATQGGAAAGAGAGAGARAGGAGAGAGGGGEPAVAAHTTEQRRMQLLKRLLDQPAGSTSKYPAVSLILPRVGASAMLRLQPTVVTSLIHAVSAANNIAGPAAALLVAFLRGLREE